MNKIQTTYDQRYFVEFTYEENSLSITISDLSLDEFVRKTRPHLKKNIESLKALESYLRMVKGSYSSYVDYQKIEKFIEDLDINFENPKRIYTAESIFEDIETNFIHTDIEYCEPFLTKATMVLNNATNYKALVPAIDIFLDDTEIPYAQVASELGLKKVLHTLVKEQRIHKRWLSQIPHLCEKFNVNNNLIVN